MAPCSPAPRLAQDLSQRAGSVPVAVPKACQHRGHEGSEGEMCPRAKLPIASSPGNLLPLKADSP